MHPFFCILHVNSKSCFILVTVFIAIIIWKRMHNFLFFTASKPPSCPSYRCICNTYYSSGNPIMSCPTFLAASSLGIMTINGSNDGPSPHCLPIVTNVPAPSGWLAVSFVGKVNIAISRLYCGDTIHYFSIIILSDIRCLDFIFPEPELTLRGIYHPDNVFQTILFSGAEIIFLSYCKSYIKRHFKMAPRG